MRNKTDSLFEKHYREELPYLKRHLFNDFLMRMFYKLCRKQIDKMILDCVTTGYGICELVKMEEENNESKN